MLHELESQGLGDLGVGRSCQSLALGRIAQDGAGSGYIAFRVLHLSFRPPTLPLAPGIPHHRPLRDLMYFHGIRYSLEVRTVTATGYDSRSSRSSQDKWP